MALLMTNLPFVSSNDTMYIRESHELSYTKSLSR